MSEAGPKPRCWDREVEGSIDADAMVGERQVRRRGSLLHVTSDAVISFAGSARLPGVVATQAFLRVMRRVAIRVLMGVVTGYTTQVRAPAIAGAGG